jgi:serine/threonine-protein kinase
MVFEWVAGTLPFPDGSVVQVLRTKATRDAPSLSLVARDAPSTLVAAVDRALARSPDARHPTCEAFARAAGVA